MAARDRPERGGRRASYEAVAVAWNLGWPVAGGLLLGAWLDGLLGSSPWATLVCSLAALVGVVRRLISLTEQQRDDDEKQ